MINGGRNKPNVSPPLWIAISTAMGASWPFIVTVSIVITATEHADKLGNAVTNPS
jgi:hypothetical protein